MRRRLLLLLGSLACAVLVVPASLAENPAWPPTTAVTPTDLMDPGTWPDDPGYGGQWNWWSWTPPESVARPDFRAEEGSMGAGTWTDMAWQHTTGDKRVVIAVVDSGIRWNEADLINQHFLNRAELAAAATTEPRCLPQAPAGHVGDPVDIDGDGFLTMRDWFTGQLPADATALRDSIDAGGNANGVADPGDLIVICTDGTDDDANGYTDDISGWDFFADDNDPSDDTNFGHGTGEARDSAAEGNNGIGDIGHCPGCRILMVRVGDSFVVDSQDYAQSVIFAVDSGASVIQEALGALNNTTFMRRANDYAYDHGAVIIASSADENSRHHNYPGTANHTVYVHANVYDGGNARSSDSFLAYNNCTNFGGQLVLSAPGTGCSSEATGVTSGVAGLVYSAGMAADRPGGPLSPPLSTEEVRQLLFLGAQDISIPESQPDHPNHERWRYPSLPGWDQRFGYGRINSYNSVVAVREGRIPPEVDIVYPDWFRVIYPAQTPTVTLRGYIDARRATDFDYVIEWAAGIEPADTDFTEIAAATAQTTAVTGDLATWDVSGLTIDNPGEIENRYTVTVRIRVTAHYGGAIGDVLGEQRRVFAVHSDPTLLPGFPVALGVRNAADDYQAASGEGSPKLADLDGDGDLEIIYADTDGLLHAFDQDATELPGFPVQLGILRGYDPAAPDNVLGSQAYVSGAVPTADLASSVILGVPAIGDLDGDGVVEIVVPTMEGDIYVVHPDGSMAPGWPVGLPEVLSADPLRMGPANSKATVERGIVPAPALVDLDSDSQLEVVIAGSDGYLYVFRHDGTAQPGFPVRVVAPVLWVTPANAQPSRIVTAPAVGDVDGDGIPDIAIGSNEMGDDSLTGAAHLIHGDGNLHAGGPMHDNWPVRLESFNFLPFIGEGVTSPIAMADTNDDGRPDLAMAGAAGRITIVDGIQPPRMPGADVEPLLVLNSANRGQFSNVMDAHDRPLLNTFAAGTFGDVDQDGRPEFMTGGAGLKLALALAGGTGNDPFNHQLGAWDSQTGLMLPGFPRRMEDYMFFTGPSVADVDGDNYPEIIIGSGGYWVHAWNGCGVEAAGWPKFTGGWITSSVAVGDIDGDGLNEAAVTTRAGYLFVWNLDSAVGTSQPWPQYRHDNHNTGNYEMPLSNGAVATLASSPLVCEPPPPPPPPPGAGGGGCNCTVGTPGSGGHQWAWLLLLGLLVWRRRV